MSISARRKALRSAVEIVWFLRRYSMKSVSYTHLDVYKRQREEELAYMRKMADDDPTARATLIERNLRLVVYIARKFENTGIGIEDLISIGTIGLIKAVNSFDPEKNIKLATYASRCIENEILMVLRRTSRLKLEVSFDLSLIHICMKSSAPISSIFSKRALSSAWRR